MVALNNQQTHIFQANPEFKDNHHDDPQKLDTHGYINAFTFMQQPAVNLCHTMGSKSSMEGADTPTLGSDDDGPRWPQAGYESSLSNDWCRQEDFTRDNSCDHEDDGTGSQCILHAGKSPGFLAHQVYTTSQNAEYVPQSWGSTSGSS